MDMWNTCSTKWIMLIWVYQLRRQVIRMRRLSNEVLLDSYVRAVDMNLEPAFIELLLLEIKRRKLHVPRIFPKAQAN